MAAAETVSISIRRVVPEDAATLARMRWDSEAELWDTFLENAPPAQQSYAEFASDFAEFVRSALASGQSVIWVAEADGRVVAHIYVHIVGIVPQPGRFGRRLGNLGAVYTVPEARNQGIGSRLMRRVVGWARQEGLLSLVVSPTDRGVPYYERAGFIRSLLGLALQVAPSDEPGGVVGVG